MKIVTSNQLFSKWVEVLSDATLASAILDRLLHHSYVFNITGNSFRIKDKILERGIIMLYIKDIFKACVCRFCENIYEYDSIDEKDFIESFNHFVMIYQSQSIRISK